MEEGQIVMGGVDHQQSVVMVTDGALGTHQFVITDGLDGGTQVRRFYLILLSFIFLVLKDA